MKFKEIRRRLTTKESIGSGGCLMQLGMLLAFFGLLLIVVPLVQMFFCAILGLRCVDEDTGAKITISWLQFIPLGLGILLFFIDIVYGRLKNNK